MLKWDGDTWPAMFLLVLISLLSFVKTSSFCSLLTQKICTTWAFQVKFYLEQNKDCSPRDSTSGGSEKLFQRAREEGQCICGFGDWEMHTTKHIFSAECCCQSSGEDVTRKEFTAFLDMKKCKNCTHKISPREYLTRWRPVPLVFREHRVPHFCPPPWPPFGGGWRSAAAVAWISSF